MVFAFFIHSLESSKSPQNEGIVLYLDKYFNPVEGNETKELRDLRTKVILDQIRADFSFKNECNQWMYQSNIRPGGEIPDWGTHDLSASGKFSTPIGKNEEGVFSIDNEGIGTQLFRTPKIVVWKQLNMACYTLVLEEDENRVLASQFLSALPRVLDEHFKKPGLAGNPKEVIATKMDEVGVLVHTFLPNGQLLFMSPYLIRHLKKEADTILLAK
mmetsp:Transcript_21564/g.30147  ORF Transcript_21564/g.30147 Transcript_21564/m.30147 type:complete len:215 (-) Transcript_21564:65-709(-)